MLKTIAEFLFFPILSAIGGRRRLRLLVHRAYFLGSSTECYFINATNLSKDKDIEITHLWIDSEPQVHINRPERRLPRRLRPDETWETWIEVKNLPPSLRKDLYKLARARLSTGKIVKSKKNKNVPPVGTVPGGPIGNS